MQSKICNSFYGLRRKQLSLTVVAVVCTTLLVWGWEKTPLVSTLLLEQWQPETLSAGCNYARGRWVQDARRRPLYSGLECKRWLSPMWACRLTQRTDFSYESFRWQPESCEIQEFDRHSLLTRLRGKTIALVGDSLGRQQFQSLMCMLTGGKEAPEVDDVGREFGLVKARGAIRPDGWAYRFSATNTTILYYWSASLCELEPLNRSDPAATRYAMHLDRPAAFLRQHIGRFDVLVLNTGHHWNRGKISGNRWDMYVNGAPLRDRRMAEISGRRISPSTASCGGSTPRSRTTAAEGLPPEHIPPALCQRRLELWRQLRQHDPFAERCTGTRRRCRRRCTRRRRRGGHGRAAAGHHRISELRDEAHMSNYSLRASSSGVQDCLHWCLPGVPDTWNEILLAQL
ncbi:unnamed protein product [Spirodela intermedia]|uniref:Uncharacterized protein n=1 Tax=Spirodela intermedia TaxID=51605 RepID=A0A7I8JR05_SPIIN|nr:unnamed protein product [Spirodela intermedia]CAA6672627.1 unnamed protein product [Spirodela intermedia]